MNERPGARIDRVLADYLRDMDLATTRPSGVRQKLAPEGRPATRRSSRPPPAERARATRRAVVVDSDGGLNVAGVLELYSDHVRATWYEDGWAVRVHLERGIDDGAGKAQPTQPERWFAAIRYAYAGTLDVFVADGTRTRRESIGRIAARVVYRTERAGGQESGGAISAA